MGFLIHPESLRNLATKLLPKRGYSSISAQNRITLKVAGPPVKGSVPNCRANMISLVQL